ncbi:MAG: hypothetical protein M1821_004759 [Bathelium mastoideum]|nr:MAG: hypothetical protein M1821_004759 [Bathelium mastoideum]
MAEANNQDSQPTDRDKLRELFQRFSDTDNAYLQGWDELWQTGFLPFDRDKPNPALVDTLKDRKELFGEPFVTENGLPRRKRALVPGCGRGYDVLLFSSFGYDAYGLDASENAVKACKEFAAQAGDQYPVSDKEIGQGQVHWMHGDFFSDEWRKGAGGNTLDFDLIYDYTFLSALTPLLRPKWAQRMSRLLAPSPAVLVCLEFPTYKDPSTGGPPYALPSVVYLQHLSRPGEDIPYDKDGHIIEQPPSDTNGETLVRIAHWKAERTHQIGAGTDHVSIWRHK